VRDRWPWILAVLWYVSRFVIAHDATAAVAEVDVREQVAAVLFAASATQAAAERMADAKTRSQRKEIEELRGKVRTGDANRKALTAAEEKYVAALAARDRAYAQEIAVFRKAVENIAATPEGATALARFNAGDEIGALKVLDNLRAARDAARKKRADIESAAEGRRIATLALEARNKGKLATAQVIARYEEVTRLDPAVHRDWVELGRLYTDTGKLPAALRAAQLAADRAENDRDRSVASDALGDVQRAQGNLTAALKSYGASLAIAKRLAKDDPGNLEWQRDLSLSHERIGDVQRAQGDLPAALTSYRASLAIREQLAKANPSNAGWQNDLSVSHNKIGDVQFAQSNLPAALKSYGASLAIAKRLAKADSGNVEWQRDLSVAHERIGDVQHAQGELPAALTSYHSSHVLHNRLAKADPGNARWQRDLLVSHKKIGDVQFDQSNLAAALKSYRASLAIAKRLAKAGPSNAGWQRDLSVAHGSIGDVQRAQGDLPAALTSYRASLAIAKRLAKADQSNAQWQRDLIVSYVKLSDVTGDKMYDVQALDVALAMQKRGVLAPRDLWMIKDLKRRAGK
jgi:tetratricopeptide (TPR) repeat protein